MPVTSLPGAYDLLVVDDVVANILAIEQALVGLPVEIVAATSGPDALRRILERDFTAILLDVHMPGMNGFEAARLIRTRERSRSVPIIFVTAHDTDAEAIVAAYELGAVDFLMKPLEPVVLRAKVSAFIELHRRADQIARQQERLHAAEIERRAASALREKADELAKAVDRQRTIEAELRESNSQLQELNLRKDEFLALLGHELRNPLAPIVTSVDLMKTVSCGHELHERCIATQERQLRHLERLVDDLLDVSRITGGTLRLQRERTDVGAVVDGSVELSRTVLAGRGQTLDVAVTDRSASIVCDLARIQQVVSTLLINAAMCSGPSSRIRLEGGVTEGYLVLRVVDRGRSIPVEMLPRVFESFVWSDPDARGLGVGLALNRRLIELHGGFISARSEPGLGNTFEVRLPVAADTVDRALPGPAHDPPVVPDRHIELALIEDNEDARAALRELLEALGAVVFEAADGRTGIEVVREHHPEVALVDIGLPDVDGYEVARELRRSFPRERLRLIAVTGFGQAADKARAIAAGFDVHLTKPVRGDEIERVVFGKAS